MALTSRAVVLAGLVLAACGAPSGMPVDSCGADWSDVEPVIVTRSEAEPEAVPVLCIRRIGERRVRIGFELPPGPDCHRLVGVEVEESADAVAVRLLTAPSDEPLGGACAPLPIRATTEIDLQAPVDERQMLDGSRSEG